MTASTAWRRGVSALAIALLLLSALPAAGLTRPNRVHAGDAQNARRTEATGPRQMGVEWVTGSAAVEDHRVSGTEGGTTGEEYGLLVHDGLVIATGTHLDDGTPAIFALDAATGEVEWLTAGVGGSCKPAIDDVGRLWAMAPSGSLQSALVALDPATGEVDPSRRLEELPSDSSVVGCDYAIHITSTGLVAFSNPFPGEQLVAVDPATAEVVWEAPVADDHDGVMMTDPVSGDLVTAMAEGDGIELVRIDPDDGSTIDTMAIPGAEVHAQLIADDGQMVLSTTGRFGGEPRTVLGVDLASGGVEWQRTDIDGVSPRFGQLALGGADGELVVGWLGDELTALAVADGSTAWAAEVGQSGSDSILVDDEGTSYVTLFAGSDGDAFAAVAADGTVLSSIPQSEVGMSGWLGAIDDEGRLFATAEDGDGERTNWVALTDTGTEVVAPGEPGVGRIEGEDPIGSICQVQLPEADSARSVLLARRDVFADALAGAPLAGDDSCILFTTGGADVTAVDEMTATEIDRVLPAGGLIRILGGENAVSTHVEDQLRGDGYTVERFAGSNRYETALAIARQVRTENPGGTDIMLAYAGNWPDAVTGGAYAAFTGTPIVLTDPDALHPTAATAASDLGVTRTFVLGGTAVIGDAAANAMPDPQRVAGSNRMATAVAVAQQLWQPLVGTPDSFTVVNLERDDSYALALGAAPLSAALGGPQLGVGQGRYPDETRTYLEGLGFETLPAAVLVGDVAVIDEGIATAIDGSIQP